MVEMEEKKTEKNQFGINVVVCCASCRFKEYKNDKERLCKLSGESTHPSEYCNSWKMAEHLNNAGKGDGRVKKKEWIDYVKVNGKSDQSRLDFERRNGSIYLGKK